MIVEISQTEWVETINNHFQVTIPEQPFAFQEWNYRSLFLMIPKWTRTQKEIGNEEYIYGIDIFFLDESENGIQTASFGTTRSSLEMLLMEGKHKGLDAKARLRQTGLSAIMNPELLDIISLETFKSYYDDKMKKFDQFISPAYPKTEENV